MVERNEDFFWPLQTNAAGLAIGSSDSEQHRSDGNDSDGSMMNLNEDLKPIGYYFKDRERMLLEMFRCVRGHKLQAILPDGLKVTSTESIAFPSSFSSSHHRKRLTLSRRVNTRDRTRFHEDRLLLIFRLHLDSLEHVPLIIDPCFR